MWREARETKPYFRIQEKLITRYHIVLSTRCHYQDAIQCLAIEENIVKNTRKKWCRGVEVEQLDELDEVKKDKKSIKTPNPKCRLFLKID
jgi:hypothetical protein